jgi:hypothetical protein
VITNVYEISMGPMPDFYFAVLGKNSTSAAEGDSVEFDSVALAVNAAKRSLAEIVAEERSLDSVEGTVIEVRDGEQNAIARVSLQISVNYVEADS